MVPAGVVYGLEYGVTVGTGVAFVLVILLLPLLALALACVLGWIVTLVSSRIRNKSLITVVLSLALLAAYYYVFLQMNAYLQRILENSAAIGGWIQRVMFPFYQMALALQSDMRALLLFAVITVCLFALVYRVFVRRLFENDDDQARLCQGALPPQRGKSPLAPARPAWKRVYAVFQQPYVYAQLRAGHRPACRCGRICMDTARVDCVFPACGAAGQ